MSCFSKALLVFRTRVPRVRYIQERLRDMRTKYGADLIRLVNVDAVFIFVRLELELEEGGLFIFLFLFFFFSFSLKSLVDLSFDFVAYMFFPRPFSSASVSEHVA